MHSVLLDTGPLVALLDRSERSHTKCATFFKALEGNIFTTEPVITEAIYLLGPSVKAQRTCIEFIIKSGMTVVPQSAESLSRAIILMEKYQDIPMDFADATLVVLAEESDIYDIFTLDKRGFNTYRISGRKAFNVFP